ncbi:hypothetical protein [Streptomyces wuyuanensis]
MDAAVLEQMFCSNSVGDEETAAGRRFPARFHPEAMFPVQGR